MKLNSQNSIVKSLRDVEKIRSGKSPKRSYRSMIDRIKKQLNEEE